MKVVLSVFLNALVTLYGQAPDPVSNMLEDTLRGVVTVEVMQTTEVKGIFGFTPAAPEAPKLNPYSSSIYQSNAMIFGSGFVLNRGGKLHVATNAHVVEYAGKDSLEIVSLTGERYKAELVGIDTIRDVAVLKVAERPGPELKALSFRTTLVRLGEPVFALGNPHGAFPSSVSNGIVSGFNRQIASATETAGYIQTTAALSPGNSGGPLVDRQGNVVGINTWSYGKSAQLNFSLGYQIAAETVDQLIQFGHVRRGSLGLTVAKIGKYLPAQIIIVGVREDAPAATRSLLEGNRLTHVNGIAIRGMEQLFGILDQVKPGTQAKIGVTDKTGKSQDVALPAVELTEARLKQLASQYLADFLGAKVAMENGKLTVKMTPSKHCNPSLFRLVDDDGKEKAERLPDAPLSFAPTSGSAWLTSESDSYALKDLGAFYRAVRSLAPLGGLTLFSSVPKKPTLLVTLHPYSGEDNLFVLFH